MTSGWAVAGMKTVVRRLCGGPLSSAPGRLRAYVIGVPALAGVALGVAAAHTSWRVAQLGVFALLLGCAAAMIEATRELKTPQGTVTRDLQRIWYLAIAVLLPPVYILIAPLPLVALKQWRVRRTVGYRRVFSAAAIGLSYAAASVDYHLLAGSAAGSPAATGSNVLTRLEAVAVAAATGSLLNDWPIALAVKLADRRASIREMMFSREAVTTDLAGSCLAALVAFAFTVSLFTVVFALPVVLMQKRFLMHAQLTAEARTDAKTGLLNASAWQREAATELSRAGRLRAPPSVILIDVDHFKAVNDRHGHLAGDRVLRVIAERLRARLREGDIIGRFGGEEFAVLLPRTSAEEARRVAERLRARIAEEPVAVGRNDGILVHVTISVGVVTPDRGGPVLDELLAAADAALYAAKRAGRNRVRVGSLAAVEDQGRPPRRASPAGGR